MKVARFVLKCVALGLCIGAAVCAVIAYWDKISELFCTVSGKIKEKRACCCTSEYDDYADFEEWADVETGETL